MSLAKGHSHDLGLVSDRDVSYEHQLISDPTDLASWLRYYWHKDELTEKLWVLKRATRVLKRSYKLWVLYLDHLVEHVSDLCPVQYKAEYEKVNCEFDTAMEMLHKMPLLWVRYLNFLLPQTDVTRTRHKFNEALRTLPLTQHHWVWPLFLEFAQFVKGPSGAVIYERYLQYKPRDEEVVLEKLMEFKALEPSLVIFERIMNDETFVSNQGKSPLDLWLEFLDLLKSVKPSAKHDTLVEQFIRHGLVKFPDQQGKLYTQLATYFISRREFNRALAVFEEGISTVLTIRDFTMIYEAYTEFEESVVTKLMEKIAKLEAKGTVDETLNSELELQLERFERLMDSREFLLDDVKIRQQPNNVDNWLHEAELYGDDITMEIETYVNAITRIDPKHASGLSQIWIKYSQIYEDNGDLHTARTILDKAVKVPFHHIEELVSLWIHWSELELRQNDLELAVKVLEIATRSRAKVGYNDSSKTVQERVHKSVKLWSFYLDLVESLGDVAKTCDVYEQVFALKVASPLTVINYANFLEDQHRFEEAFKVYERGISIFKFPVVFEIWNIYLTKALKRLSVERMRDLFDHALEGCPPELAKTIIILYSQFEEDNGSIQRSAKLLERGIAMVDLQSKPELLELLVHKTSEHFGLLSTRPVFTLAIESLPPSKSTGFIVQFAQTEEKLLEMARVRAILQHGALLQPPAKAAALWEYWGKFEVEHGNRETYKEMLKWKRRANEEFDVDSEQIGFVKSGVEGIVPNNHKAEENPDAIELDI